MCFEKGSGFMEFRELDSPDYQDIPIYDMGYGIPCDSPIVICRYNEQDMC